jgi:hypothetical protein
MAEEKKDWTLEVIAAIIIALLLWLGYNKRKRIADTQAGTTDTTTTPENVNPLVDPFAGKPRQCEDGII